MTDLLNPSPGNPVPPNCTAGHFRSHDGLDLRYAIFRSQARLATGTIVLLHGRNESIEKYFETIADLNAMGLWVATFDWRGQGLSPRLLKSPRRGHLRRFSDLERDLETFLQTIVLPDTKLPFYIVAHSMGALVALKAAPRLANRIERMVLSAPFVGAAGYRISNGLLKLIARGATLLGFGGMQLMEDGGEKPFAGNKVTSDPVRYERNNAIVRHNPGLGLGPPTARWISCMIGAIETSTTMSHLRTIEIPTLILAPGNDEVVPFADFEALSRRFRAARLIAIAGAKHEVLQERDIFRSQALAAIEAFIPGSDADPTIFLTE